MGKSLITIKELVSIIGKEELKKENYIYDIDYKYLQNDAHNLLYLVNHKKEQLDKLGEEELNELDCDIEICEENIGEDWSKLIKEHFKNK